MEFKIPIQILDAESRSKAKISYSGRNQIYISEGRTEYVYVVTPSEDTERFVRVKAGTIREAYKKLREAVFPNDERPIQAWQMIKYFKIKPQN